MALFECPVCHGTYQDPDPNGGPYFHVCPPLSGAELAGMPPGQVHALVPDLPNPFTRDDLDRALFRVVPLRPGARDENVVAVLPRPIIRLGDPHAPPEPPRRQDQPPRIPR